MWAGRHFPPARCQWGGTQDVVMRLSPSSHSKSRPSSPPSLSCCLLGLSEHPTQLPSPGGSQGCRSSSPQGQPHWSRALAGSRHREFSQAGSEGTAGSGCVLSLRRKSLLRVILNQGPAILKHSGSRESSHHPQHVLGGPWAQIHPSPGGREGHPCGGRALCGEEGPRMGDSPTWVTGMSSALVAAAESCQAPAPLLLPPRNAATATVTAKSLPGSCPVAPTESGGDTGDRGRRCHQLCF